ncbi:hypothetical protein MPTK1_2g11130 [Marchantia polymorpha subsp. ruderalis]|uniref:N-acetyltransferase domain-containing protein n=2 Tax=Marchantia polymorpha TaxID=3197 RepID=A0A176VJK2_MARPO|nr:hypothetical protein AXG93_872s1070 [Marchantia polymorpha subsp. ruderalis]PTQ43761.1 hypothetical protein MARPO_0023s0080 [Marchantia polymorpha]BBN01895.1 hypothetical protein Mp_2g11130 [Marchantia polymorpha subsp. ruderalis]|eukprot:PTQ43761.1 hypothetical protein MARPO_0023s0080 [Marchantia polymorpha]
MALAPVMALVVSPNFTLRRSPPHCFPFQAYCPTSLSWNVTYASNGRRTIRGDYDGVDIALSNPSRTSNPRTKVASSGVNSIIAEDAVDLIIPSASKPPPPSKPEKDYIVREAKLDEELWAAAWIRAESYCEDQPYVRSSGALQKWGRTGAEPQEYRLANRRYIESYMKNFAEQEFDALKRRLMGKYGQSLKCICFVTVKKRSSQDSSESDSEKTSAMQSVVGTLDLSVRQLAQGEAFPGDSIRASLASGAPDVRRSQRYGYVSNVCVSKTARRKGIGSSLLQEAIKSAKTWELKELFVHVNASNKAAFHLYTKYNFQVAQEGAVEVGLNNIILLRREL